MKIVKIQAPTLKSALQKVKNDLGRDAVVLKTDKIEITPESFYYQITAAIDYDPKKVLEEDGSTESASAGSSILQTYGQNLNAQSSEKIEIQSMKKELQDMAALIRKQSIGREFQTMNRRVDALYRESLLLKMMDNNEAASRLVEEFSCLGFDQEFIMEMVEEMKSADQGDFERYSKDYSVFKDYFIQYLEQGLNCCFSSKKPDAGIQIIWGPPGTGKTTTIAKIAAKARMDKKKVALITLDNYRIAGAEQLRRYAHILDVPFFQAATAEEVEDCLLKLNRFDYIFIDTPGISRKNQELCTDIRKVLGAFPQKNVEHILTVEGDGHHQNLAYHERFFSSIVAPTSLVVTKFDQVISPGNLIKHLLNSNFIVKYITNGQSVPQDICVAHPSLISEVLKETCV